MQCTVVVCPFALFGSPGTQHGAELLADAVREMLDDVKHEKRPTRGRAFRGKVHIEELAFDGLDAVAKWRETARAAARAVLKRGDFLIWLGGNHLSVLPVYEELAAAGGSVVQFDAHLDLYNLDDCKTELNHGNFLRHASKLPPIVNIGHRDLFLTRTAIHEYFEAVHPAGNVDEAALREWSAQAGSVFLDIDCDVLDPAYFPATTHPLSFGLSPDALLRLIGVVWSGRIRGVALSEFDPGRDRGDRSLQLLVWLIEWVLLRIFE